MNLLLENCPDIILLLDKNDCLVYCTNAFLEGAGIRGAGLVAGRHFREVFTLFTAPDWADHFGEMIRQAKAERRTVSSDVDSGLSGSTRNFEVKVTPMLGEDGTAEGSLTLFHDVTDVMRAKQQAERANRAKSDFLATVSHEIRTPMNAIIGISDMMKKTRLDAQQRDYLSSIQNSSYVLLNLINDILDFSKIEAGKLELVPEYFSLEALLSRLTDMFLLMFERKNLRFVTRFAPDLPQVVLGDEKRVGQVLTNILNNALKYTGEGTVEFSAHVDAQGCVCFDIKDTGIGIREEDIPRLFTAFEQLDKVKNKKIVGTGLGLAITKKLCETMNGSISVTSSYGQGSCFSVRLCLPVGTRDDMPGDETPGFSFVAPRARVLLVDDIEINLVVAAAMLEGYEIVPDQAMSGEEAVRLARQNRYDLIFMDHMMPEMDGVLATAAIRALGGYAAKVPIVALTANAVSGAEQMFLESGMDGFLSKPIDPGALAACLFKWLPSELIEPKDGSAL